MSAADFSRNKMTAAVQKIVVQQVGTTKIVQNQTNKNDNTFGVDTSSRKKEFCINRSGSHRARKLQSGWACWLIKWNAGSLRSFPLSPSLQFPGLAADLRSYEQLPLLILLILWLAVKVRTWIAQSSARRTADYFWDHLIWGVISKTARVKWIPTLNTLAVELSWRAGAQCCRKFWRGCSGWWWWWWWQWSWWIHWGSDDTKLSWCWQVLVGEAADRHENERQEMIENLVSTGETETIVMKISNEKNPPRCKKKNWEIY